MSTLHLLRASPDSGSTLTDCLEAAIPGATILLIENGVYGLQHPGANAALREAADRGVQIRVLEPDARARGVALQAGTFYELVDYTGFVELVTEHKRSVTWS